MCLLQASQTESRPQTHPIGCRAVGEKTQSNVVVEPESHGALFGESIKAQLIYSIAVRTH